MSHAKSFAEFLFKYRSDARVSQQVLADKVGVSRRTAVRWERGEAVPNITNLGRLEEELHIPSECMRPFLPGFKERRQAVEPEDCVRTTLAEE